MKLKDVFQGRTIHRQYRPIVQVEAYTAKFAQLPFILVHVPKTGGTSILKAAGIAAGRVHATAWELRTVCGRELGDRELVAVYREPVSRLLSAYQYYRHGGNGSKSDAAIQSQLQCYSDFDSFVQQKGVQRLALLNRAFWPQSAFLLDPFGALVVDRLFALETLQETFQRYAEEKAYELPPIGCENKNTAPKPEVTSETATVVRKLFKDDVSLAAGIVPSGDCYRRADNPPVRQ